MRGGLRPAWPSSTFSKISGTAFSFRCKRTLLTRAFDTGPSEPPLLEQTVPEHFASIVSQHGDRPAVISRHQQKRLTYEALDDDSNALARGLEQRGVEKGSRVAVSLGNNVEFATLTYALFKLGAILVPLNPAFTPPQIASALNHLTASHLIISAETNLPRKSPASNLPTLRHLVPDLNAPAVSSEAVPSLKSIILVDNASKPFPSLPFLTSYTDAAQEHTSNKHSLTPRTFHKDDIVNIQFTSGTTSMPKAASLTHRSILNNGRAIGDRMALTEQDIICCCPPLFHCFGCILGYMATATHGSCIVFPTEAFDPLATLHVVHEYKCTALYGVPTMFLSELALLESSPHLFPEGAMSTLRTGIAAGSQIPATLMRRLHAELNLKDLTICYGMTETSPVSVMTSLSDSLEKRTDSVGKCLPHVTAKIVVRSPSPPYKERVAEIGERGELVVSGYLVMKGYWGDEEKTGEVRKVEKYVEADETSVEAAASSTETTPIAEKSNVKERVWMHTGDEGVMDAQGYVKITGRLKDIIIRGGENVHPLDVEDCLLGCEGVAEVSAFGVSDERYGECVAVAVVRRERSEPKEGEKESREGSEDINKSADDKLNEDDIRTFVRQRLANHLIPAYVFFVASLPKTPSGKIQRFKLRAEVEKRLGIR